MAFLIRPGARCGEPTVSLHLSRCVAQLVEVLMLIVGAGKAGQSVLPGEHARRQLLELTAVLMPQLGDCFASTIAVLIAV